MQNTHLNSKAGQMVETIAVTGTIKINLRMTDGIDIVEHYSAAAKGAIQNQKGATAPR